MADCSFSCSYSWLINKFNYNKNLNKIRFSKLTYWTFELSFESWVQYAALALAERHSVHVEIPHKDRTRQTNKAAFKFSIKNNWNFFFLIWIYLYHICIVKLFVHSKQIKPEAGQIELAIERVRLGGVQRRLILVYAEPKRYLQIGAFAYDACVGPVGASVELQQFQELCLCWIDPRHRGRQQPAAPVNKLRTRG